LEFSEPSGAKGEKYHYGSVLKLAGVGKRVLSGRADAVELNGIDRWIGGTNGYRRFIPAVE